MSVAAAIRNEEAEIRQWLDGLELPETVVEYRLLLDNDWEGDPKVDIYFILTDSLSDREFHEEAQRIRRMVMDSFYDSDLRRWPYPHFRQKAEQDALDAEERRHQQRVEKRRRR